MRHLGNLCELVLFIATIIVNDFVVLFLAMKKNVKCGFDEFFETLIFMGSTVYFNVTSSLKCTKNITSIKVEVLEHDLNEERNDVIDLKEKVKALEEIVKEMY